MVESFMARLKITPEEAALYNPSPGMSVTWLEFKPSKNEAVGSWCSSTMQPDPLLRKSAKDLEHEVNTVFRNRVLENNLQYHHLKPRRLMILESLLEHPQLQPNHKTVTREIKRAVEAAIDVHEVELTDRELKQIPKSHEKEKIEPIEMRQRTRKVSMMGRDGVMSVTDEFQENVNVFTVGTVDSG